MVTTYFFSEPQESIRNCDNDVNHAIDVDERPETFTRIPESTLGLNAMVTVSKNNLNIFIDSHSKCALSIFGIEIHQQNVDFNIKYRMVVFQELVLSIPDVNSPSWTDVY